MPFFKEFRRKKSSAKHLDPSEESKSSDSNGTTNKSSSTLDSLPNGTSTPASSIQPNLSNGNLVNLQNSKSNTSISAPTQRPVPLSSVSNRSSFIGLNTPSINGTVPPKAPLSAFAPRIVSISENSWVHQKVLLVYGHIGEPNERPIDGTVCVCHHQDNFPTTSWPVSESHFKALVHLTPGPNRLRFDFTSPKVTSTHPSLPSHCSWLTINFLPLTNSPPLQLAIILGKDSPGTFDSVPERKQREGHDLALAIRKFRMSAYLWQAFTAEQMYRQGFGRRCFRFEEEWQSGTLTNRDRDLFTMRNEARVHVIRSEKTVAELRDLDIAQQNKSATRKGELFNVATEACRTYFKPQSGRGLYVSALFLDSHWDTHAQTITGHAAIGGASNDINLAIFGSHALQSYPASLEEVVPAFSDCTRTDTHFVANVDNMGGSNWEAANFGIGAHLHETGHLFGCPHRDSGIMKRDYLRFSRTFLARESYCTRTKSPGLRLALPKDECSWSRLDTLCFKYHPCFGLPTDAPLNPDNSIQLWPADNGKVILTAATGIAFLEMYTNGEEECRSFIEYGTGDVQAGGPPRQVVLSEDDIRQRLGHNKKAKDIKIKIFSAGLGTQIIDNFNHLLKDKDHIVKLPHGQLGFKGRKLGLSAQYGSITQQVLIESAFIQKKLLTCIKVFHGAAVEGLEFQYEDSTSQLFGSRGSNGDDFTFDTRRGEILLGFYVRASASIDGLEILTSLGRRSSIYGNARAGKGHTLIAPRGYNIAGISGTCGRYIDGFSLIITR